MTRRTKQVLRVLRRPFEWLGIGLGLVFLPILPRRAMLALCDFASSIMYVFDGRGKRLALENLRIIRGTPDPQAPMTQAEECILRRSYRNMSRSVGYAFWTCVKAKRRAASSGEMSLEGKQFLAANKPAVTVSGHLGCWEILSQLAFLEGHPMMSVAKDIGSRGMTRLLMKARESIGQTIVRAEGAFRPLMAGLRAGKSLGLLVDQVVDPMDGGVWVRFFGKPFPASAAPAFFAAKGHAPVAVAWSRPLKDGRWRCDVIKIYKPEDARDIWGFTQNCLADLERVIRRHPSCWVLNYRYFRKTPTPAELAQLETRELKRAAK